MAALDPQPEVIDSLFGVTRFLFGVTRFLFGRHNNDPGEGPTDRHDNRGIMAMLTGPIGFVEASLA